MALLDVLRRPFEKVGRNLENYMGGLLGEDVQALSPEDRRRLRQRAISALAEGMATMTPVSMTLREAAGEEVARRQRIAKQRDTQIATQDAQQAQANIAARLGGRGVDVGEQMQLQEVRPMSGMNLEALLASPAGAAAVQANPQLAEMLKQRTGQQVVGGSIYDRATGQFITPPEAPKPRTPVREIRRGNVVDVYFSDGTMRTMPVSAAPTAGGVSAGGDVVALPGQAPVKLSAGEKKRDTDFATSWNEFSSRGGFADTVKQLTQLQDVLTRLEGGEDLTGAVSGFLMQNFPSVANAVMAGRVGARDAVEEVVQRNLRLILGAQFTKEEGDRLIARAYNPSLGEEENAKRLRLLIQQMLSAASAKQSAGEYFEQYGTLKGYKSKLPSFADFSLTKDDKEVDIGDVPAGIDPRDWAYMTEEQRKLWR